MKTLTQYIAHRSFAFAALFTSALFLFPSMMRSQAIDNCSSGVVDSQNGVEQTVCIYGDSSSLTASGEVDNSVEGYPDDFDTWAVGVGLDTQLDLCNANWLCATVEWDSGDQQDVTDGSGSQVTQEYQFTPVSGADYNVDTTYDELICETGDWSCPGDGTGAWSDGNDGLSASASGPPSGIQGFINPKYFVVGVTYAPPGPSSYVQYTGATSIGNTVQIGSTFSNKVGFSISVSAGIQGWGTGGSVTGTSSTDYTQSSNTSTTTTLTKATSLTYKTGGTGNAYSPVSSDYDVIWLWLNPVVVLTYTAPTSDTPAEVQWNGYGYDTNDPSGTQQPDIYPVLVGWLDGDFGDDPSVDAVLARSWASGSNYVWPSGQGPGLTPSDISQILASDPFAGCTYDNSMLDWTNCPYATNNFGSHPPSTTPDGRFTLVTVPNNPNPVPYEQAGPGNGAGITTTYSVNQMNTQSVAQGTSTAFTQEFSMEEVFSAAPFGIGIKTTLNQSDTLSWTSSWLNTLTTTTTLQQALSLTGPSCPADPGPCNPLYAGPGQFDVYQDNQYGTFMFYPTN